MLQRPCKLPIAPMGISHVLRLCLQGGGVFIDGGTVTFLSCTVTGNTAYHVLTLKLPIAPMGYSHILLVVCRAAVSLSRVAR